MLTVICQMSEVKCFSSTVTFHQMSSANYRLQNVTCLLFQLHVIYHLSNIIYQMSTHFLSNFTSQMPFVEDQLSSVTCQLWPFKCYVSSVTCEISTVTSQMSSITCHYVSWLFRSILSDMVAVVGKGKSRPWVKGPYEQILRIVELAPISQTDILLLRLETSITFNRYVKYLPLRNRWVVTYISNTWN